MTAPVALAEPSEGSLSKRSFTGTNLPQELLEPDESDLRRARILLFARAKAAPSRPHLAPWVIIVESSGAPHAYAAVYLFDKPGKAHPSVAVLTGLPPAVSNVGAKPATAEQVFDAIQALYLTGNPRSQRIAARIIALHRDAIDEGEHIPFGSLSQITQFFLDNPDLAVPKITLTPDGTLHAHWVHGARNFVSIEYLGGDSVKLVAEMPSNREPHFSRETIQNVISKARAIDAFSLMK